MENTKPNLVAGMLAGLLATVVLTVLMLIKGAMGIMPDLDPVHMMASMASEKLGIEAGPIIGWVMHFGVGVVAWGGLFALLFSRLPGGSPSVKGVIFGVGAWLMMMVGPMPMSGAGLFALEIGPGAPVMTLVFHLIFGIVLGRAYARLARE